MFASDQHGADETAAWLPRRQRSSWHRLPAGAVDDDVEEVCGDDDDVEDDDTVAKDNVEDDGGDDDNDNCNKLSHYGTKCHHHNQNSNFNKTDKLFSTGHT